MRLREVRLIPPFLMLQDSATGQHHILCAMRGLTPSGLERAPRSTRLMTDSRQGPGTTSKAVTGCTSHGVARQLQFLSPKLAQTG